jgi:AcrR family transcriptional regulator
VGAALEFIETEGLPNLTMRKLGAVLGVEAVSLYRYVPGL